MTTMKPARAVASFDSASAFLESLARALARREFPYLGQSRFKVPLVYAGRALPTPLRRRAYAIASGREGVPPDRLGEIDLEQVAQWVTAKYPEPPVPAVLLGSSNGALVHLAAACGIPWLPQTLLIPVCRAGVDPQDYRGAAEFGVRHGASLLDANPGVQLHHMHDADQDPLSASQMAYFRVKWRTLPLAYRRFLDARLAPGAPVVIARDTSTWPVTRYGERHVFQAGARGGMTAEEYLARPGVPDPDDTVAEAEWGYTDELSVGVREWAKKTGHPVVEIRYDHPQDPAAYDDIDVMLFNHGAESRGLADADAWQRLADRARRRGRLLGVDPSSFPADFTAFVRYSKELRSLPDAPPPEQPLPVDQALAGLAAGERVHLTA